MDCEYLSVQQIFDFNTVISLTLAQLLHKKLSLSKHSETTAQEAPWERRK